MKTSVARQAPAARSCAPENSVARQQPLRTSDGRASPEEKYSYAERASHPQRPRPGRTPVP